MAVELTIRVMVRDEREAEAIIRQLEWDGYDLIDTETEDV